MAMASLIDRLRASRESWVEVGGFGFRVRRPTALELARWQGEAEVPFLRRVIVGWRDVRELDLVPGGDGSAASFDADVCAEWLEDRPELYVPLMNEVNRILEAHVRAREEQAGK